MAVKAQDPNQKAAWKSYAVLTINIKDVTSKYDLAALEKQCAAEPTCFKGIPQKK